MGQKFYFSARAQIILGRKSATANTLRVFTRFSRCIPRGNTAGNNIPQQQSLTPLSSDYTCNAGDFKCHSDSSCVLGTFQCDGELDCLDGSDEYGCKYDYRFPAEVWKVP